MFEITICEKIKRYLKEVLVNEIKMIDASKRIQQLEKQKYFICKEFSTFSSNLDNARADFSCYSDKYLNGRTQLELLIPLDITVNVYLDEELYNLTHILSFGPLSDARGNDYIEIKKVKYNDTTEYIY